MVCEKTWPLETPPRGKSPANRFRAPTAISFVRSTKTRHGACRCIRNSVAVGTTGGVKPASRLHSTGPFSDIYKNRGSAVGAQGGLVKPQALPTSPSFE